MGKVILFSQFDEYFNELLESDIKIDGTILDANVIITLSYSPKKYHTRILDFLDLQLYPKDIPCFTTVNTTFEFLEFHRRLLMTEGLRDSIDEFSKGKLPNKKRQIIRFHSNRLKTREDNQGADPVFYDREIKDIRKKFASDKKGLALWSKLCESFLSTKLQNELENLDTLKVQYLSIHKDDQKEYFTKSLEWEDTLKVCAATCASLSDSMILNALQCTTFPFAMSLDTDVIYATITDPNMKDIIVPDDLIADNNYLHALMN